MKRSLGIQWEFAILLIVLFVIAAIGVWSVLSFLSEHLTQSIYTVVAVLIWTIAMGFMLIAGAFGLWAIRFAAEVESRRRIGQLVDTMDYISDGLFAVNAKGRIVGSNPAARRITASELAHEEEMAVIFPCLSETDLLQLLKSHEPAEVEREIITDEKSKTLRFRAQPSEDLVLLIVSDITAMNAKRLLARQSARLQLLGQLARGVAHDFNQILWSIATHSSLIQRLPPGAPELLESTQAIVKASERGADLANHLLQLSQARMGGKSTHDVGEHLRNADLLLKDSMPYGWSVECTVTDTLPPVPLSGPELEQVVLNLGLLLTEIHPNPGRIRLIGSRPHAARVFNVDPHFSCVILLTAIMPDEDSIRVGQESESSREAGVILSVIRSMIQEIGGQLDELFSASGAPAFRLSLPHAGMLHVPASPDSSSSDDMKRLVANWTILLALPQSAPYAALVKTLRAIPTRCQHVSDVASTLAELEPDRPLDAIVVDKPILGPEASGILKAMLKLKPSAAFLVLCDDPDSEPVSLRTDVVYLENQTDPAPLLKGLADARILALRRGRSR